MAGQGGRGGGGPVLPALQLLSLQTSGTLPAAAEELVLPLLLRRHLQSRVPRRRPRRCHRRSRRRHSSDRYDEPSSTTECAPPPSGNTRKTGSQSEVFREFPRVEEGRDHDQRFCGAKPCGAGLRRRGEQPRASRRARRARQLVPSRPGGCAATRQAHSPQVRRPGSTGRAAA